MEAVPVISINAPQIGQEEIDAVVSVLKSGMLTNSLGAGPRVLEFEQAFAKLVKSRYAIAVNSGTAALHLAISGSGVGLGDEVILPSFTFVATAEAIVLSGGKPIFVDIDPQTYNISPEKIEEAITKNTKAIMPVDMYGLPAHMPFIRKIADKHGLFVIEDAAQAHGAVCQGKPAGAFADAACWSFYPSKNMTTGEGGMVTTDNIEFAERLRYMRTHGEKEKYKSILMGFNYRLPEIQATIGCVQLRKLPKFLAMRRRNAKRLTQELLNTKDLELPDEPNGYSHSWYLYTVRLRAATKRKRDKIVRDLHLKGIGAQVYYINPVHLMPYYRKYAKHKLPETERASEQVFSLPIHPGVTLGQIKFIGDTLSHLLE